MLGQRRLESRVQIPQQGLVGINLGGKLIQLPAFSRLEPEMQGFSVRSLRT